MMRREEKVQMTEVVQVLNAGIVGLELRSEGQSDHLISCLSRLESKNSKMGLTMLFTIPIECPGSGSGDRLLEALERLSSFFVTIVLHPIIFVDGMHNLYILM